MCAAPAQSQDANANRSIATHNRNMLLDRVYAKAVWSTCAKPASPCATTDFTWGGCSMWWAQHSVQQSTGSRQ